MQKKKVLFIILPYIVTQKKYLMRSFLTIPYGVLSIATFIKDIADIEVFDCNLSNGYAANLGSILQGMKYDVIGISMMFDNSYSHLKGITETVKYFNPEAKILLGGAATTFSYKEILEQNPDIDAICYGEGEWPMRDLIRWNGIYTRG